MLQVRYMNMPTQQQILIRLPEEVAARLKSVIPARTRNKFVSQLVVDAIAEYDKNLAKLAIAVTAEEMGSPELTLEMQDWNAVTGDGIDEEEYDAESSAR